VAMPRAASRNGSRPAGRPTAGSPAAGSPGKPDAVPNKRPGSAPAAPWATSAAAEASNAAARLGGQRRVQAPWASTPGTAAAPAFKGLQFHGSQSIESVHLIDQESPAAVHLSQQIGIRVAAVTKASNGARLKQTGMAEKTLHPRKLQQLPRLEELSETVSDTRHLSASMAATRGSTAPNASAGTSTVRSSSMLASGNAKQRAVSPKADAASRGLPSKIRSGSTGAPSPAKAPRSPLPVRELSSGAGHRHHARAVRA